MPILVLKNEATAARRRVYFHCVDATDGMTPETGEAGGQPEISVDGAAFTNTGIGVLVAIGNGRYYAVLTQAIVNVDDAVIESRYKSAATAEAVGSTVQVVKQWADILGVVGHADYGNAKLVRSTTPANALDVSATGEAGLDFNNIKDASGAHTLTNITVPEVSALTGHTAQTADHTAGIADIPTVAEFNARSIVSADYFVVGDYTAPLDAAGIRTAVGLSSATLDAQLNALGTFLLDVPTVSEFNARTIVSADYFVVTDYTAPDSAATIAAAILASTVDVVDLQRALKAILAAVCGKAAVDGNDVAYKARDGNTTDVTVTHDASGNRSASTFA